MELRRRFSQGLQFSTSYVYGKEYDSTFFGFTNPAQFRRNSGDPGDLTHNLKANVVYDLPFGRGRRFAGNAGALMERLVGGWQVGLSSIVNSGRLVDLGNVRVVGMTQKDVQSIYKLRFDDAGKQIYMFPQDVIDNTILAFAVSATSASGYAGNAPTGRYFAPANGPDCIENEQDSAGQLRHRLAGRHRSDVPAARHPHLEAHGRRRPHQLRVRGGNAQRVQPPELPAGQRHQQFDRHRLPAHRPAGHQPVAGHPDRAALQLVATIIG